MNPQKLVLFGLVWLEENAPKGQFTHSPRQAQRRLGYFANNKKQRPVRAISRSTFFCAFSATGWWGKRNPNVPFAPLTLRWAVMFCTFSAFFAISFDA